MSRRESVHCSCTERSTNVSHNMDFSEQNPKDRLFLQPRNLCPSSRGFPGHNCCFRKDLSMLDLDVQRKEFLFCYAGLMCHGSFRGVLCSPQWPSSLLRKAPASSQSRMPSKYCPQRTPDYRGYKRAWLGVSQGLSQKRNLHGHSGVQKCSSDTGTA